MDDVAIVDPHEESLTRDEALVYLEARLQGLNNQSGRTQRLPRPSLLRATDASVG
jgi:hypothetical protein